MFLLLAGDRGGPRGQASHLQQVRRVGVCRIGAPPHLVCDVDAAQAPSKAVTCSPRPAITAPHRNAGVPGPLLWIVPVEATRSNVCQVRVAGSSRY